MKHFIDGTELTDTEIQNVVKTALAWKKDPTKVAEIKNKIATLLFSNPSLRTRLSFESGIKKLKGNVNIIDLGSAWNLEYNTGTVMNTDAQEHIKEAAKVVSRYSNILGLRNSALMTKTQTNQNSTTYRDMAADTPIRNFAKYATVPVINMESNMHHPCQGLADVVTMQEALGTTKNKKYVLTWAPHPKALPLATPHSQLLLPSRFGLDITLVHPPGFDLDPEIIKKSKNYAESSGGSLTQTNNQETAFQDADIIMAKSWASQANFGDWTAESTHRKKYLDWQITEEKMKKTKKAKFCHCLPVRRNVVVSDKVLDSTSSIVIDQAENRMWAQMALIEFLLKNNER